jgi:deoxyadenosine/deoxycytidine kinase
LFARINLNGDELETYNQVHEALAEKIPLPDLIVYLKAETDVLMQRIANRDRPYERNIEIAYIESLNQAYNQFFNEHRINQSVLIIDTNHLDFVVFSEHLQLIEDRIRQTLKLAPYQSELPLKEAGSN